MLQCPKQTFARLFYNVSTTFLLLFIFFHLTFLLLSKLFIFFGGNPFYQRNQDGYEFDAFSDEEEVGEQRECCGPKPVHSVAETQESSSEECFDRSSEETRYSTPAIESSDDEILEEEEVRANDTDSEACDQNEAISNQAFPDRYVDSQQSKIDIGFKQEAILVQKIEEDEIFGDAYTIGSTSKDSSEWRSSINCRDSCTEDPFSSSSRRSCHKWESYTVFQKYDEEMLFLDRISVQKLHETETLRSIKACPRSISDRIVHKFRTKSKKSSENPYHELESAYVAQICLTWEALNWNYKYFQRLRTSRREFDPGCPAYVAQQFQQFQVLLQRYVENEPYEHGRRPEIYARMRSMAPKLLQVPEYRDSDIDLKREEGSQSSSRIPSSSFTRIMQESIKTFMNFLKQDKQNKYQVLAELFRRSNRRGSADANLLLSLKKVNTKKKARLRELRRSGKCLRKRKLKEEEELEILMAQLDLKVVSRVLRMSDLNGEQLHWCENKMSKVRVSDGKLHRDSSPLFFPAH